ncbi:PTS sugar transporter subunit IIC, partial [Corallococcus exiguus]
MNVGWTQVALACLWGGLVAVERKAFLQAMLSRPLVAATFMGALLGDVGGGLSVGMLLELFYLGTANLGASLPENDTLAATGTAAAAATLTAATGAGSTPAIWSLAVLLFIGLGRV